jgi:hypothetical protein
MVRPYLKRLYRDRHRFALSSWLLLSAAWITPTSFASPIPGVSAELALMLGLLLAMPLVAIWARKWRFMIEVMALAALLFALTGRALPGSAADLSAPQPAPLAPLALFAAMIVVTSYLLYGRWSDRFVPRHGPRFTARGRSRLEAGQLWVGLFPTPGQAHRNPDPEVMSIEYADRARRMLRLITWMPPHPPGETLLHIDRIAPFREVRFRMEVVSGLRDKALEGTTTIRIEDRGTYRRFTVTHTPDHPLPRRLLRGWLDDTLGRMMDARLAAVERLAAGQPQGKPVASLGAWFEEPHVTVDGRDGHVDGYRTPYGRRASDGERDAINDIRAA